MNNIEFIDKNIEKCKELINDIENTSDELKGIYDEEEIIKARAEMKEHIIEQIKQFKEIKNILEAWYVVKRNIYGNPFYYQITISRSDKEAYETFEKALEVENE